MHSGENISSAQPIAAQPQRDIHPCGSILHPIHDETRIEGQGRHIS
jgi:hypothetical protein